MRGLAALLVAGGTKRVVFTDAAGRYRFDELPARTYRINLDASAPERRDPASSAYGDGAARDVHGVDLVVTPR